MLFESLFFSSSSIVFLLVKLTVLIWQSLLTTSTTYFQVLKDGLSAILAMVCITLPLNDACKTWKRFFYIFFSTLLCVRRESLLFNLFLFLGLNQFWCISLCLLMIHVKHERGFFSIFFHITFVSGEKAFCSTCSYF